MIAFPKELQVFVNEQEWTFAKTMNEWPHEYLVRQRVDQGFFEQLVRHIRTHGYEGRFYEKPFAYYDEAGMVYWTMGAPIGETTIVNRCKKEVGSFNSRSPAVSNRCNVREVHLLGLIFSRRRPTLQPLQRL